MKQMQIVYPIQWRMIMQFEKEYMYPSEIPLYVTSIFETVSGEVGIINQGQLCTFVRLAMCDLRCTWCDAKHSLRKSDGKEMSVREVFNEVFQLKHSHIVITGGEPLLQKEPLSVLVDRLRSFYTVQIETSGHMIDAEHTVRPSCWVVDYKLKGSAMNHRMMPWVNYSKFNAPTYIKFVVANEEDVIEAIAAAYNMKQESQQYRTPYFAFSPVHGEYSPLALYTHLQKHPELHPIVNLQVHKYMGLSETEEKKIKKNF